MQTLVVNSLKWSTGFFSQCSIFLKAIAKFVEQENKLPEKVETLNLFLLYKASEDSKEDLYPYFFEKKENPINFKKNPFTLAVQFSPYKKIDFDSISPYIKCFFSPSAVIRSLVCLLEKKYSIDYENMCAVYYRGNDKIKETKLASYEDFFKKTEEVLLNNPNKKILIQTDELEFAEAFKQKFPNSFWFDELSMINHNPDISVHHSTPRNERKEHAFYFLSAILIMSKMKHLITYSGNCGLWTVLYRGNAKNVHQYLAVTTRGKDKKVIEDFGWV